MIRRLLLVLLLCACGALAASAQPASAPSASLRVAVLIPYAQRAALAAMALGDLCSRRLEMLSGGERRRAWLAMVLAQEPELLLLDEPTTALDLRHQWQVVTLFAQTNRERGLSLVIALHDLAQAAELAHRVAVMHRGRLYAMGPPERCLTQETLRDVFAVDACIEKIDGALTLRMRGPATPIRSL